MDTQELDTKPAGRYALAAYLDARMKNSVNASLYTEKQKAQAEGMRFALELVYSGPVHLNYRQKGISLKVEGRTVKDRANLRLLEEEWASRGIQRKDSPQGVIYHVKHA